MKRPIVNYGESVRARLLSIAKKENVQMEYILLRYALERFLYRLGKSRYVDTFILKGASAFAVWLGPLARVTRDADMEVFGMTEPGVLVAVFKEICAFECHEDAVEFDMDSFSWEGIKKDGDYPGTRIRFAAMIGGARVSLQFDIAFGDSVYPPAEKSEYPPFLETEAPCIRIYPRYTVIAEKLSNMIVRGMLNSRLKDYYDVWLLSSKFDFDGEILGEAIARTFARRNVELPKSLPDALTDMYGHDAARVAQWNAFLRTAGDVDIPESLSKAIDRIRKFTFPFLVGESYIGILWSASDGDWVRRSAN